MLWIEMSRDLVHGAGSWDFTRSLWSPTRNRPRKRGDGSRWAFWESLLQVRAGDSILHLRGKDEKSAFVGFSLAETDGFRTTERPPEPGEYSYADSFYRVPLKDFSSFPKPIGLRDVFTQQDEGLRSYFERNKSRPRSQKRRLFYVIQSSRLQCLNGAYLSEVDDELAHLLLGPDYSGETEQSRPNAVDVRTAERLRELRVREGQQKFSDNVRDNYGAECCFPCCTIVDRHFLVGAHIARWADAPELRGSTANGLCFCLMHDRAFEKGLFTVAADFKVVVKTNDDFVKSSKWCATNLIPFSGLPIKCGRILPTESALRLHWARTGFTFR